MDDIAIDIEANKKVGPAEPSPWGKKEGCFVKQPSRV